MMKLNTDSESTGKREESLGLAEAFDRFLDLAGRAGADSDWDSSSTSGRLSGFSVISSVS